MKRFLSETLRVKRHDIAVELFLVLVIGTLVSLAFALYQNSLEDRRDDRAEMLSDVSYVRETLRDGGPKIFRNLNLRGANLSGLDMGCDLDAIHDGKLLSLAATSGGSNEAKGDEHCADFYGSDFTGANLGVADLTGANLRRVIFAPEHAEGIVMSGATVSGEIDAILPDSDLRGAVFEASRLPYSEPEDGNLLIAYSDLRGASFHATDGAQLTLITSRTDMDGMTVDSRNVIGHIGGCRIQGAEPACDRQSQRQWDVRMAGGAHFPHKLQIEFNEWAADNAE